MVGTLSILSLILSLKETVPYLHVLMLLINVHCPYNETFFYAISDVFKPVIEYLKNCILKLLVKLLILHVKRHFIVNRRRSKTF